MPKPGPRTTARYSEQFKATACASETGVRNRGHSETGVRVNFNRATSAGSRTCPPGSPVSDRPWAKRGQVHLQPLERLM
jgi:hypothetical protein